MSDTCLNIIGLRVKQKHYLSDFNWLLVVVNIWQAVFLFTTEKTEIHNNFQSQRKNIKQFF